MYNLNRRYIASALSLLSAVLALGTARGETAPALEARGCAVLSGCERDYPPYCVVAKDGRADGFSVELMRAALRAVGREVAFETGPWVELKRALAEGRLQALPLVGRSPEREALYDFTFPYLTMHGAIVVRRERADIRGAADLGGKRVAVLRGDSAEEFLRGAGLGAVVVPLPSFETALRELAEGRHDAVVIQRLLALQLMRQAGLKDLMVAGPPLKEFTQSFCFAVRKGDGELLAALNEGLSIAMADGTFRALCSKWFAPVEALGRTRSRVVVGGDSDCPPYEFIDRDGRPAGFNVALTRAIARHMGVQVDIRLGPWAGVRQGLARGDIDLAQAMYYSAERDAEFNFSPPTTTVQHAVVVREGAVEPADLGALAGKSIVVMAGDLMEDEAVRLGYAGQLVRVATQEEALRQLAAGKGDCALVAKVPALYWIEREGWRNLRVSSRAVLSSEPCYAVPHGKDELLDLFSEGLAALKATGEYRRIQAKWLGPYEEAAASAGLKTYGAYAAGLVALLLLLLCGALLWSRALQRQVAERTGSLTAEIAERERTEWEQQVTVEFLRLVNESQGSAQLIRQALGFFRKHTECDAVGIRLRDGGEYGNFWSAPGTEGRGGAPEADRPPRAGCDGGGYASVALLPLHHGKELLGLLQVNSHAKDVFTLKITTLWERLADYLAVALSHARTQEALSASEETYRSLFENMLNGLAHCRMLYDADGKACDFVYLGVNRAFEAHTGLRDVVGRRVSEVIPGILRTDPQWLDAYGRVASTGQPEEFERYLSALDRWFHVAAYSPKKDHFVAVFDVITERKRAEAALRESEARLRTLGDNIPGGVLYQLVAAPDGQTRYTYLSAGVERVFGFSAESVVADHSAFWRLIAEEDRPLIAAAQEVSARELSTFDCEFRQRTRAGAVRWFHARSSPRRTEDGSTVWDGVVADITERKQAEEALRESEGRFRSLIEAAPDAIFVQSAGRFTYLNPAMLRLLGAESPEQVLGTDIFARIAPEHHAAVRERIRAQRETGKSVPIMDQDLLRLDGTRVAVETTAVPIRHADRDAHLVFVRDVTARKLAEAERERLLTAIDQSGEIIVITDPSGAIQYVNPAFERATGYTRQEVAGQNPRLLKSGKQDPAFYRDLWQTLTRGETWNGRFINKRKDGTLYTEEATISPVRNAAHRTVSYVAVKRDITEHLHLAEQLQQAQKMESVGRLAGGVAHDFNNMLSVILGCTELALNDLPPDQPVFADLQEIRRAAERSADLTRQLLAFARKQPVLPKVLDLNATVAAMLKMLRRLIGEDIELAWLPGHGDSTVKIDPSQIDQILANLAVNARDAIAGVGRISIATGAATLDPAFCAEHPAAVPGDYVTLTFRDSGCGMDAATLEHAFEPFFTTKGVGEGTGLGLSIVYGIAQQNRGLVTVSSAPAQGTTFTLYLPRCTDADAPPQPPGPAAALPPAEETVLLVEDEPAILRLSKRMLESLGHRVEATGTPAQALDWAEHHDGPISLLVTDVVMPEMTGWDLAARLRLRRPRLKVLLMSGYTSDVLPPGEPLSADTLFIQKPFSKKALAAKLHEAFAPPALT